MTGDETTQCKDHGWHMECARCEAPEKSDETNNRGRCLVKHYSHGDGSKCVYYSEKEPVAWTHKQIAALEARNAEQKKLIRDFALRNEELFNEKSDLEKRNTELTDLRGLNFKMLRTMSDKVDELEQKLKTAEDAMAAATKEKDEWKRTSDWRRP